MNQSTITELEKLRDSYLTKANALTISIDIIKEEQLREEPKEVTRNAAIPVQEATKSNSSTSDADANSDIVLSAITKFGRFIKKSDIDKSLSNNTDITPDVIRSTITYLKKKGVVVSYQASKNNVDTFWGLSKWIQHGNIHKEFMYDINTVVSKI